MFEMALQQPAGAVFVKLIERLAHLADRAIDRDLQTFVNQSDGFRGSLGLHADVAFCKGRTGLANRREGARKQQADQLVSVCTECRAFGGKVAVGVRSFGSKTEHDGVPFEDRDDYLTAVKVPDFSHPDNHFSYFCSPASALESCALFCWAAASLASSALYCLSSAAWREFRRT